MNKTFYAEVFTKFVDGKSPHWAHDHRITDTRPAGDDLTLGIYEIQAWRKTYVLPILLSWLVQHRPTAMTVRVIFEKFEPYEACFCDHDKAGNEHDRAVCR